MSQTSAVPLRKKRSAKRDTNIGLKVELKPRTETQRQMIEGFLNGVNVLAHGSAGSGKSYVACYLALRDLFDGEKERVVFVRSAVSTRDMGFLPGSLEEKSAVYQTPFKSIVNELCGNGTAWDVLTKKGNIEFITTSYIRGTTLNDAVLIVEEFQNMDAPELESVLTRVGENTQVILCGDTRQSDLFRKREKSGVDWIKQVAERMPDWFDVVEFKSCDIVRSGFVKNLIQVIEDMQ
jgi:phosphate starvation-inducible protein PhoH